MKKTKITAALIAFFLIGAMHSSVQGQSAHCMGLKNPTNFVVTGGAANSAWVGYTGNKPDSPAQASTCTSLGSTFSTTPVPAASLATTTGGTTSC